MVQRGVSIMKATKASLGVLWAWFRLPNTTASCARGSLPLSFKFSGQVDALRRKWSRTGTILQMTSWSLLYPAQKGAERKAGFAEPRHRESISTCAYTIRYTRFAVGHGIHRT